MRLRFWLLMMDVAGWLDNRFDREWTWRLWLWACTHAGAAVDYEDAQGEVGT